MSFDCGSYSDSCSEDDSDSGLAELEARLYSQYHYQGDFDDDIDKNESQKEEGDDVMNAVHSYYHKFQQDPVKIELPAQSAASTKTDTKLRKNPFHCGDIDSDDESSEDEGIIAVSSDNDDSVDDIENITIFDDDDYKSRKNKPILNIVNNTKDITKNKIPQTSLKKYNRKKIYVADFGSDFSENFLSSDLEDSDESVKNENCFKVNFLTKQEKLSRSIGMRISELNEINEKPAIVPRKWNLEMKHFYSHINKENLSLTTDDIIREDSGNWQLTVSDRYALPANRRGNRYYTKTRCSNCNQIGHYRRDCGEPIKDVHCSMCGAKGHRDNGCPRTCCLGCGAASHMFRSYCYQCKQLQDVRCKECGIYGHKKQSCPDLWRRFHCTTNTMRQSDTSPRNNQSYKTGVEKWCCNCGEQGHLVHTCRYRKHVGAPLTVCSYEPVNRLLQDERPNLGKRKTKRKDRKSSFSPPPKKRRKDDSSPKKFKSKKLAQSCDSVGGGKSFFRHFKEKKDKIAFRNPQKSHFLDNNLLAAVANFSKSQKQASKQKRGQKKANKASYKEQYSGEKSKSGKIYKEKNKSRNFPFNNSIKYKSKKQKNTHIFF